MRFQQADLTKGLPMEDGEKLFDMYFTSYGTCSHFNDDEMLIKLLAQIAKKTEDYCIIVLDFLGRYSYEWQNLWRNDIENIQNMDYVVSYIYDKEGREKKRKKLQHLNLRLVSKAEILNITNEASRRAETTVKPLGFFDRSIFVGRHMDTMEYNSFAQSIRQAVNSLHESNTRTELNSLIVNYIPKEGFDFINNYFEHLQMCWNTLVKYTNNLLSLYDEKKGKYVDELPSIPSSYPPVLKNMIERMIKIIEGIGWLNVGLPRENVIEPQLGYALRTIMNSLQKGEGCSHSIVGIFEVDKEK
jgi:hypothetical protein